MYSAKKVKGTVWDVFFNGNYAGTAYDAHNARQAIKIVISL